MRERKRERERERESAMKNHHSKLVQVSFCGRDCYSRNAFLFFRSKIKKKRRRKKDLEKKNGKKLL